MALLDDIDAICPLPPDPDDLARVVSRAGALAAGYSRRAIAHRVSLGRWRRIHPRTYLTVDTLTARDELDAALLFAGEGAAISGAAALLESGVRGVRRPSAVLVLVPPSNRTRSTEGVRVRRTFRSIDVVQWVGARRVQPARAAADLALDLHRLSDVRALVARVVQDGHASIEELGVELDSGPRQGSALLRRALQEVGWGAVSAPEAEAARILRSAGVDGFAQNATIGLPDGSTRVVDFYWPRLRACLEIDSVEWHFDVAGWSGTWQRHLELSKFGYSVIHRPPSALRDEVTFVRDVRTWLIGREADLRRGLAM